MEPQPLPKAFLQSKSPTKQSIAAQDFLSIHSLGSCNAQDTDSSIHCCPKRVQNVLWKKK
eukprot:1159890-Pelagomonas_calceolata.AAC.6